MATIKQELLDWWVSPEYQKLKDKFFESLSTQPTRFGMSEPLAYQNFNKPTTTHMNKSIIPALAKAVVADVAELENIKAEQIAVEEKRREIETQIAELQKQYGDCHLEASALDRKLAAQRQSCQQSRELLRHCQETVVVTKTHIIDTTTSPCTIVAR